MFDSFRSRFLVLVFAGMVACAGTADARVRQIESADQVESLRFLSANNCPVKVIVAYSPETENENFVISLINIVAEMHESGQVKKEDAFKVHVIPTVAAKGSDFAILRKKVSPQRLKQYVEFSSTDASNDMWMQDWGEVGVIKIKSEAKPQLAVFDSNRGRGLRHLPSVLASFWNSYLLTNPSKQHSSGDYGGNIEVTPDNILLLGNTSTPELRAFLEENGYAGRIAVLETDWLKVGHVDEYISVCPSPKSPLGYTLIKANPRLALRLIKNASVDELKAIPQGDYRDMMIKVKGYLLRAEAVKKAAMRGGSQRVELEEKFRFGQELLNYLDKPESGKSNGETGEIVYNRSTSEGFRVKIDELDFDLSSGAAAGSNSEAAIENFIKLNLSLAKIIDDNVKKAGNFIAQARKENGRRPPVISFPSLFRKAQNGKHIAYLPGSVNQLILNNQLIVPDPKVESLRRNIAKSASILGLKANFVDSMAYHTREGQLHCGSNVFRHPNKYFVKPR